MRRRRRIPEESTLMITSMMDMFTIILVFLLNFFDPQTQAQTQLELPPSASAVPVDAGVILEVSTDAVTVAGQPVLTLVQGRLSDGTARDGRTIDAVFTALSRARGPTGSIDAPLVVRCDRNTSFALLGDILYTAGVAGWSQYRFVVVSEAG
jgi:biopolymer transport protein ExbD